jgi:beta-glucosidase
MKNDGAATVSATITNTGAIAGDEIVQFYIHQKVSSVTRPVKELRGFQRIHLAPGEKQTVTFPINRQTLAFHDLQMNYTVEPGDFEMMIGPSSAQVQKVTLHVTE